MNLVDLDLHAVDAVDARQEVDLRAGAADGFRRDHGAAAAAPAGGCAGVRSPRAGAAAGALHSAFLRRLVPAGCGDDRRSGMMRCG